MPKDVILTPEGLSNLKAELEHLATIRRREVAARIKEAREFGDISENAEYDDAKNEQAMLEARIATLEDKLRSATVIDAAIVHLGAERAGRYLRRFYPWYVERLGLERPLARALAAELQQAPSFAAVRRCLQGALLDVPLYWPAA